MHTEGGGSASVSVGGGRCSSHILLVAATGIGTYGWGGGGSAGVVLVLRELFSYYLIGKISTSAYAAGGVGVGVGVAVYVSLINYPPGKELLRRLSP